MSWDADGWMEFLEARAHCIRSMREQGLLFTEVASTLNLQDAAHAERIYEATKTEETSNEDE